MIGTAINSLRAWKAIWDMMCSEKPEHRRQREELMQEWECIKQQAREGAREVNDLRLGRKVLASEQPMIRGPFKTALWILLAVILVAMLFGGYRSF